MSYKEYYAHINESGEPQLLQDHLEGTARRAKAFASAFGAEQWGELAGIMHDIGKYSEVFQKRIRDPEHTAKVDHATAGAKECRKMVNNLLAFVIVGHHSGLPDGGSEIDGENSQRFFGRMKRNIPDYSAWKKQNPIILVLTEIRADQGSTAYTGFPVWIARFAHH